MSRKRKPAATGWHPNFTIPDRPDGSRWIYTPSRVFKPTTPDRHRAGRTRAQDPAALLLELEAIKPHRDPKPRKLESIEAYAKRQAERVAREGLDPDVEVTCIPDATPDRADDSSSASRCVCSSLRPGEGCPEHALACE